MIRKLPLAILPLAILSLVGSVLTVHAQEEKKTVPVQFRAVLHDPVKPIADLYFTDKTGAVVPLNFRPQDLSETLLTLPLNGSLVLYDKATIDPKNPAASLAASVKLPPDLKRVIVIVLPSPEGEKPAYRMLLIDDSEEGFPKGESRVVPLMSVEAAIEAGEHKVPVHPGKIAKVPPVKKVDEFNMAQTNFYYNKGETWVAFTERQLHFIDACRRIFIIHTTPGALNPRVTTIVDVSRPGPPR
jgi:hypothetical protein